MVGGNTRQKEQQQQPEEVEGLIKDWNVTPTTQGQIGSSGYPFVMVIESSSSLVKSSLSYC